MARVTIAAAKALVALKVIAVAIEAVTAVVIADAVASDVAVGVAAEDAAVKAAAVARAGAIFRHRNTPRRKAISAATIRADTTIATTAAVRVVAVMTIAEIAEAIVAVRATTIAAPKAVRGRRLHRNRAVQTRFCCRASRSQNIAAVPRRQRRQRPSSSTKRTTSRNRSSMNRFPAVQLLDRSRILRVVLRVCPAGC